MKTKAKYLKVWFLYPISSSENIKVLAIADDIDRFGTATNLRMKFFNKDNSPFDSVPDRDTMEDIELMAHEELWVKKYEVRLIEP